MHWFWPAVLIGIAGNIDNLGVGMAYGMRRIGIPWSVNLFIAAVAGVGTWIFARGGHSISSRLAGDIGAPIGALVVIAVGVWVLWPRRPVRRARRAKSPLGLLHQPECADRDFSGHISFGESLGLATALGVNAWAGGLGGGMVGIPAMALAVSTACFSYLSLWFGASLSRRTLGRWLGPRASVIAGLLLILIGLKELF